MAKYIAVYKCPLCGNLIQSGKPQEVSYKMLPELLGTFVNRQKFASNPYLDIPPVYVQCQCADGSAGLAQFAGLKKI